MRETLINQLFKIEKEEDFRLLAKAVFKYQTEQNELFKKYSALLKKNTYSNIEISEFSFLPISFFKSHLVSSLPEKKPVKIFESSGTTGSTNSKHLFYDLTLYEKSFLSHFESSFPYFRDAVIIGLLPSYLERNNSSLVYMVNHLIQHSTRSESGFYLNSTTELINILKDHTIPKIMFGVTFALLDLAEKNIICNNTIVIETGGMKGRRKEIVREELHALLQEKLKPTVICSEYGMTELNSQAYLKNNKFVPPKWMKVFVRDLKDPIQSCKTGKGALNIIDLANIDTCAFIATDDIGEVFEDGAFTVSGRTDHAQIRGCNLLFE